MHLAFLLLSLQLMAHGELQWDKVILNFQNSLNYSTGNIATKITGKSKWCIISKNNILGNLLSRTYRKVPQYFSCLHGFPWIGRGRSKATNPFWNTYEGLSTDLKLLFHWEIKVIQNISEKYFKKEKKFSPGDPRRLLREFHISVVSLEKKGTKTKPYPILQHLRKVIWFIYFPLCIRDSLTKFDGPIALNSISKFATSKFSVKHICHVDTIHSSIIMVTDISCNGKWLQFKV